MSRILRRPMFRGGGTVNSYGTGITAPLVPGYMGGGQIGGGIVYGKPMADGRFGFQAPIIPDLTMPASGSVTSGLDLLARNKAIKTGAVPFTSYNIPGVEKEKQGETEVNNEVAPVEDIDFSGMDSDFDQTETVTVPDGKGGTKEIRAYKDQSEIEPSPIVKLNMPFSDYDREDYNRDMKKIETDKIQERLDAESDGVTGKGGVFDNLHDACEACVVEV